MTFAQTATISVGSIAEPPLVGNAMTLPVTMDAIDWAGGVPVPNLISGFALFFSYDASVFELKFPGFPADFSVAWDPFWSGSFVANVIVDDPMPGYNTMALVYATGGVHFGANNQRFVTLTSPTWEEIPNWIGKKMVTQA
jgi:hypothetical protein